MKDPNHDGNESFAFGEARGQIERKGPKRKAEEQTAEGSGIDIVSHLSPVSPRLTKYSNFALACAYLPEGSTQLTTNDPRTAPIARRK